jgi:tRNA pseudouridine13 synthase
MYVIKKLPEDFMVKELSTFKTSDKGKYSYWLLRKKDYTTMEAVFRIAGFLQIPLKDIGFAGAKDRQAISEQYISIKSSPKTSTERLENFRSNDISLTFVGYNDEPISLGNLEGNHFDIVIRDVDSKPASIIQFVNYFDEQRFSENNHLVGKAILKRNFKAACEFLVKEEGVGSYLLERPSDFVGAIKTIPLKTRMMFVHAFQSYVFNETVKQYLQCKYKYSQCKYSLGELIFPSKDTPALKNEQIPIVGFDSEYENPELKKIIKEILKSEEVSERDFLIRPMPELSSEGSTRDLVAEVKNLVVSELEADELHAGKKKCRVSFNLKKGNYATMAIRFMMC